MDFTVKRLAASLLSRFRTSERGAILVEALLVIPVFTVFALALIEFGFIFWERQQLQAGVRDAARYMSRCNVAAFNDASKLCSFEKARTIATKYYDPSSAQMINRLPGTTLPTITITPTAANFKTITTAGTVTVTGTFQHFQSPVFALFNLAPIPISYTYSARYMGW